jgi:hypothetical protein
VGGVARSATAGKMMQVIFYHLLNYFGKYSENNGKKLPRGKGITVFNTLWQQKDDPAKRPGRRYNQLEPTFEA